MSDDQEYLDPTDQDDAPDPEIAPAPDQDRTNATKLARRFPGKLTKKQMREFGSALVDAATDERAKQRADFVLAQVTGLLKVIDELKITSDGIAYRVAFYEKKVAALRAGQFNLRQETGDITFHDPDLNRYI